MHLLECILNFRNASMPVLPPEHDNPGAGWCSRDSDKAKGWTFRGSNPGRGKRFFFPQKHQGQLWAPPSLQLNGDRVSFPGVKLPGREVDHSPPCSAIPSPVCFHGATFALTTQLCCRVEGGTYALFC